MCRNALRCVGVVDQQVVGTCPSSQRYDFLSAGMGAMVVTTFCFSRGQDVGTALWISAAATVGAVVLNELLFSSNDE